MGNRAIVTTPERKLGVYLHWNGSRDFVEPFCAYCGLKRFRAPSADLGYGTARLVQVIANFFGGGLSVGVVPYTTDADMVSDLDNGVYVIDGWQVTERVFPFVGYAESDVADMAAALHAIDARQPGSEGLGAFIDARPRLQGLGLRRAADSRRQAQARICTGDDLQHRYWRAEWRRHRRGVHRRPLPGR